MRGRAHPVRRSILLLAAMLLWLHPRLDAARLQPQHGLADAAWQASTVTGAVGAAPADLRHDASRHGGRAVALAGDAGGPVRAVGVGGIGTPLDVNAPAGRISRTHAPRAKICADEEDSERHRGLCEPSDWSTVIRDPHQPIFIAHRSTGTRRPFRPRSPRAPPVYR